MSNNYTIMFEREKCILKNINVHHAEEIYCVSKCMHSNFGMHSVYMCCERNFKGLR
jgi:hypothetical protein